MEYNTSKHHLPDRCSKQAGLETMVLNVKAEIDGYVLAGFTRDEAILRVRSESCAGVKVWEKYNQRYGGTSNEQARDINRQIQRDNGMLPD